MNKPTARYPDREVVPGRLALNRIGDSTLTYTFYPDPASGIGQWTCEIKHKDGRTVVHRGQTPYVLPMAPMEFREGQANELPCVRFARSDGSIVEVSSECTWTYG